MVDAAIAGLDQGEFASTPSLPDASDWQAYGDVRRALFTNLSRVEPAKRYLVSSRTPANLSSGPEYH
jgi:hypothetical protein